MGYKYGFDNDTAWHKIIFMNFLLTCKMRVGFVSPGWNNGIQVLPWQWYCQVDNNFYDFLVDILRFGDILIANDINRWTRVVGTKSCFQRAVGWCDTAACLLWMDLWGQLERCDTLSRRWRRPEPLSTGVHDGAWWVGYTITKLGGTAEVI